MKKLIISLLLVVSLVIPFKVEAVEIEKVTLTAPKSARAGTTFDVVVKARLGDIKSNTQGLFALMYEIDFDDQVLELVNVDAESFDNEAFYTEKYFQIMSSVIPVKYDKCNDNFLFCSNIYKATLTFYVKSVDYDSSKIRLLNMNAASFLVDSNLNYNMNNLIYTSKNLNKKVDVKIVKDKNIVDVAPKEGIVLENTKSITDEFIQSVKNRNSQDYSYKEKDNVIDDVLDSNMFYITDIYIDKYSINFDRENYKYNLVLPDDVNQLDIKVTSNSSKIKYNISGANDLKSNNDSVSITVNNGTSYVINIERGLVKGTNISDSINSNKNVIGLIISILSLTGLISVLIVVFNKNKTKVK